MARRRPLRDVAGWARQLCVPAAGRPRAYERRSVGLMMASWINARRPGLMEWAVALALGLILAANTPGSAAVLTGLGGVVFGLACARVGQGAGRLARLTLPIEQRFLIGLVALAYLLAAPTHVLGTPIAGGALAFLLIALVPARAPDDDEVHGARTPVALCLAAATGFALIWSLESSRRLASFARDGVFRLWTDFFIHAGVIAEFGDVRTIGRVNAALADVPGIFYHFVSFALPGLAVRLTGLSPMASVGAVWLPLGIFATALGVFALGRAVAGVAGGALSLLLLAAAPDAASYGLHQGFLSFHWLLETGPGALYALPCACVSLALLIQWSQTGAWRPLVLSAVMLMATFLLRAHILVWIIGPWAATYVVGMPRWSVRVKAILLAGGAVAAMAGMLLVGGQTIRQAGLLDYVARYIEVLHLDNDPTAYDPVYPWLMAHWGRGWALIPGLLLAYLGMGGLPLLTFLAGGVLAWRRGLLRAYDIFPNALLVWAGILMLLAPIPFHGDSTDFRQRGFLLVVIALYCWNARWIVLLFPPKLPSWVLPLAACAGLIVTVFNVAAWKAPQMGWGPRMRTYPVAPGLITAAAWLRANSGPATAFTVAFPDSKATLIDDATTLMGLSGAAAWLSRPELNMEGGGPRAAATRERTQTLEQVAGAPNMAAAMAILRRARVAFYVVNGPGGPAWDASRAAAAFRADGVAIYRTGL